MNEAAVGQHEQHVRAVILERLVQIEREHDVTVLLAIESGSRAWGFASPDSDWDVRFIYVQRAPWYFRVEGGRDVIESGIEQHALGELDINGWELRKSLQLLHKSNPALLEWLQSPLVYRKDEAAMTQYAGLAKEFFKPLACFHHYLSMALNNQREFLTKDSVRLKKYLYVLRPLLACVWIENGWGMPPIEFHTLLNRSLPDGEVRQHIDALLVRKMAGVESETVPPIAPVSAFIERELQRLKNLVLAVEEIPAASYDACDAFLMRTVLGVDVWSR